MTWTVFKFKGPPPRNQRATPLMKLTVRVGSRDQRTMVEVRRAHREAGDGLRESDWSSEQKAGSGRRYGRRRVMRRNDREASGHCKL